jgi:type IX secretion system substrate protein/NHL repeat-containing protein
MKRVYVLVSIAFYLSTNAQIINTVAGSGPTGYGNGGYAGDGGQATAAEFNEPIGVTFDAFGNLYIADYGNNRIRMINTAGITSTVAGNGTHGYTGDGVAATAAGLNNPTGVAFDAFGNLYIADFLNNRIRMVNTAGIISTFAGDGTAGYNGDGGAATAARLYYPFGLAFDVAGNLYIADELNNVIRMVNTAGIITTVVGNGTGSYSGDGGQATNAELHEPTGVTFDAAGNMYIADEGNMRIRKVNTANVISTFAGNGTAGYSGDGSAATAAKLNYPDAVAFDAAGNLYIVDNTNNRIRKVNTAGIISTFVGTGSQGFIGDGGAATAAALNTPSGVAFDGVGNLYIGDNDNNRVRIVSNGVTVNSSTICSGATTTLTANGANAYSWSNNATTASITPSPTVTTSYTVTGTAFNINIGTAISTVSVNALPTLTITASTQTICIGGTSTLTVSGANTYTWSNTGATGVSISASPTVTVNYTVTGTDGNGCINMDTLSVIVENCTTGINEFANSKEVNIYPNPNNGSFVIESSSITKQTMQLYDVNGKFVLSQTINGKTTIDASSLNEGVYNISIISGEGVVNKRLVIVR